jgi:hypothetical protein
VIVIAGAATGAQDDAAAVHAQRVHEVRRVSGLAAFWDFVTREPGAGRFVAHTARPDEVAYPLDAVNHVRDLPRERLHDGPLDVGGPGQRVSWRSGWPMKMAIRGLRIARLTKELKSAWPDH